mmetsp:Transcript_155/g.338  ORF Transcript_155/g.338 Transcript_155/m.338 type:complete len:367 (-) Transcript_155:130-1230(-)
MRVRLLIEHRHHRLREPMHYHLRQERVPPRTRVVPVVEDQLEREGGRARLELREERVAQRDARHAVVLGERVDGVLRGGGVLEAHVLLVDWPRRVPVVELLGPREMDALAVSRHELHRVEYHDRRPVGHREQLAQQALEGSGVVAPRLEVDGVLEQDEVRVRVDVPVHAVLHVRRAARRHSAAVVLVRHARKRGVEPLVHLPMEESAGARGGERRPERDGAADHGQPHGRAREQFGREAFHSERVTRTGQATRNLPLAEQCPCVVVNLHSSSPRTGVLLRHAPDVLEPSFGERVSHPPSDRITATSRRSQLCARAIVVELRVLATREKAHGRLDPLGTRAQACIMGCQHVPRRRRCCMVRKRGTPC